MSLRVADRERRRDMELGRVAFAGTSGASGEALGGAAVSGGRALGDVAFGGETGSGGEGVVELSGAVYPRAVSAMRWADASRPRIAASIAAQKIESAITSVERMAYSEGNTETNRQPELSLA
jgi:hypothetical protein